MSADNYFLSEKVGLLVIELDRHLLLPVIMNLQHMARCSHFAFTCCNDWKINFENQRPATDSFLMMSDVVIQNCLKNISWVLVFWFMPLCLLKYCSLECHWVYCQNNSATVHWSCVFMFLISINCIISYWNLPRRDWEQRILGKYIQYLISP